MPELPEVEMVVRGLRDDVVGRTFTGFSSTWPRQIAPHSSEDFAARIAGQGIRQLWRRAKYIVFDLSDDVLLIHLKMTGRLYVAGTGQTFEDDRWVRAVFGMVDDITANIGPEPLSDEFTLTVFQERLARRKGTVKPLLLNQSFLAGVGNIYADEALWLARIDPRRQASTLNRDEVEALYETIRRTLADGIEHEGASVDWYRKPDGRTGSQQNHFAVYDQAGQPCPRCGTPIQKIWLAQRGTHFCPACQS